MTLHRFAVRDEHNPWARAVEVDADDPDEARARAESWLFARRTVSGLPFTPERGGLVHLTLEER